jgi:hypothetical protein
LNIVFIDGGALANPEMVRTDRRELGEAKLMALGPGSGRFVRNKAINFSFPVPFLSSFLFA